MASRKTAASTAKRSSRPARPKSPGNKKGGPPRKKPAKAQKPVAEKKPVLSQAPHGESFDTAMLAAQAALGKKAEDVVILDVRGLTSYADYFVVATGASDRQVSAIADAVDDELKKAGHPKLGIEGYTRGQWVLIDFADVVVHVFYTDARGFYDVEGLWADAKRIPVAG